MLLDGKKVIVIGGASGIGLATAQAARKEGANIIIAGRSPDKLEQARASIGHNTGAMVLDILDEGAHRAFFDRVGAFDHLVLTASQVVSGSIKDTDTTAVRVAVESRVWGSYYAAKYGSPHVRAGGSITLFSGSSAWKPIAGLAAVAASCGAVEALTLSLAVELAPIRVNAVRPGATLHPDDLETVHTNRKKAQRHKKPPLPDK